MPREYTLSRMSRQSATCSRNKDKCGDEGGQLLVSGFQAPLVLRTSENYYNRAYWKTISQGDGWLFENVETELYLFQNGEKIKG